MDKKKLISAFEGKTFNVDEAKKIAIALERQGFRFYNGMKDRVKEDRVNQLFTQMAEEEKKHISDIEALLSDPNSEWYLDPATEEIVQQYFEEYMEGGLFPSGADAESMVMKLEDEIRAVEMALHFETDAVAFYKEMVKLSKDGDTREAFEELVAFEKEHVQLLGSLLKALKA